MNHCRPTRIGARRFEPRFHVKHSQPRPREEQYDRGPFSEGPIPKWSASKPGNYKARFPHEAFQSGETRLLPTSRRSRDPFAMLTTRPSEFEIRSQHKISYPKQVRPRPVQSTRSKSSYPKPFLSREVRPRGGASPPARISSANPKQIQLCEVDPSSPTQSPKPSHSYAAASPDSRVSRGTALDDLRSSTIPRSQALPHPNTSAGPILLHPFQSDHAFPTQAARTQPSPAPSSLRLPALPRFTPPASQASNLSNFPPFQTFHDTGASAIRNIPKSRKLSPSNRIPDDLSIA